MFCPKCGAQNADNTAFCSACGNRLTANVAPQPAPQPTPQPAPQPAPQPVPEQPANPFSFEAMKKPSAPRSSNPQVNILKNAIVSPLYLAALGVASISAVMSAIVALVGIGDFAELLKYASWFPAMYIVSGCISFVADLCLAGAACTVVTALWLMFAHAVDRRLDGMNVQSFSIVKIGLLASGGSWLLSILGELLMFIAAIIEGENVGETIFPLILELALVALAVVVILFALRTSAAVEWVFKTGRPCLLCHEFMPIACFIVGGLLFVRMITLAVVSNIGVAVMVLTSLMQIGAAVCFGIALMFTNKKMNPSLVQPKQNSNYYANY